MRFSRSVRTTNVQKSCHRLGNFWVVETDYLNYALIYGCNQLRDDGHCHRRHELVYVISRTPDFVITYYAGSSENHSGHAMCGYKSTFGVNARRYNSSKFKIIPIHKNRDNWSLGILRNTLN